MVIFIFYTSLSSHDNMYNYGCNLRVSRYYNKKFKTIHFLFGFVILSNLEVEISLHKTIQLCAKYIYNYI